MKDKTTGFPIKECVGLRSKVYSYLLDDKCIKNCKGIVKGIVRNKMHFDDYRDSLLNSTQKMHSMKTIRSHNHKIKSYE